MKSLAGKQRIALTHNVAGASGERAGLLASEKSMFAFGRINWPADEPIEASIKYLSDIARAITHYDDTHGEKS